MTTIQEVLRAHWSASTHTDRKPFVDKCDGCGAVVFSWGDPTVADGSAELAAHQAAALTAAGYGLVGGAKREAWDAATSLIAALIDPEDCHFDHHGGCQAHGYLSLEIGELCPQLEAKAWLRNRKASNGDS